MIWTRIIFLVMLFGLVLCNRFVDNRLLDFQPPYASSVKNSDAQKIAILESMSNINFMAEKPEQNNNDLAVLYSQNPYQQLNQIKDKLRTDYDYNNVPYVHETNKEEYEPKINMDLRSDFSTSNQELAYAIKDLNRMSQSNSPSYAKDGDNFMFSNSDDETLSAEEKALSSIASKNVAHFYDDLLPDLKHEEMKRGSSVSAIGCDCKIKNDLLDLGQRNFPRYLLNAVCQTDDEKSNNEKQRCWRGICKPLEYKVKVLTLRTVKDQKDPALAWLPDDLRQLWKFKTVTVSAGCFCVG